MLKMSARGKPIITNPKGSWIHVLLWYQGAFLLNLWSRSIKTENMNENKIVRATLKLGWRKIKVILTLKMK
jgi:hypothetical protein